MHRLHSGCVSSKGSYHAPSQPLTSLIVASKPRFVTHLLLLYAQQWDTFGTRCQPGFERRVAHQLPFTCRLFQRLHDVSPANPRFLCGFAFFLNCMNNTANICGRCQPSLHPVMRGLHASPHSGPHSPQSASCLPHSTHPEVPLA